jgi:transcriptional regulator with PAS, ATPase and Fis domain
MGEFGYQYLRVRAGPRDAYPTNGHSAPSEGAVVEATKAARHGASSHRDARHDMVGASNAIRKVSDFVGRVAPTDATVLIEGESGTGKELVARAIHRKSTRAAAPFVAINCAAIPEQLMESELFGHARGSFTGAFADKKGKLELANGGTVFLDEIGELPLALQSKLLRTLQEREVDRVGGTRPVQVDVRVITATNADLRSMIRTGAFRQDLYFRLNVVSLRVPPLRERPEDIPLLAAHFTVQSSERTTRPVSGISPDAMALLLQYDWPGNVRELQNAIERAVVLGDSELILTGDLPEAITKRTSTAPALGGAYDGAVREFKRQLILSAISETQGNLTKAAKLLHVNGTYLHRLIRTLDLRPVLKKADGG